MFRESLFASELSAAAGKLPLAPNSWHHHLLPQIERYCHQPLPSANGYLQLISRVGYAQSGTFPHG